MKDLIDHQTAAGYEMPVTLTSLDVVRRHVEASNQLHNRIKVRAIMTRVEDGIQKLIKDNIANPEWTPQSSVTVKALHGETENHLNLAAEEIKKQGYSAVVTEANHLNDEYITVSI